MENVEYEKLPIDKENDEVSYNDSSHVYWTKKTLNPCISVTTLIGRFTTFDKEFWSKYKALESMLTPEDFAKVKPKLLDTKKFNDKILDDLKIDPSDFEEHLEVVINEWGKANKEACDRGTKIHLDYELKTLANDYSSIKEYSIPKFFTGGTFKVNTNNKLEEGQYVLPELLLSRISNDGELRLAGQADLVIVDGRDVYILDFKSNKEIKQKSFYDKKKRSSTKMKYPLNHLDDVNYFHYEMQLSTYAWIIEKNNPNFNIKGLFLLHHDHKDNKTVYECKYRKKDVERMLVFYKKELHYNNYKKNNQK